MYRERYMSRHSSSPSGPADVRRALDALRRIVGALRASSRAAVREAGVTGAQLFVLQQIAEAPGESIGTLARRTLTRQNTVSEVVGRLVRLGLVSRQPSPADGRRAILALTARGDAVVARAPGTLQERLAAGLRKLPPSQRRALADGLDAWVGAAGLDALPLAMFFEAPRRRRGAPGAGPAGGVR